MQIQTQNFDFKTYKIINMLGQTVQKGSFNHQINIDNLKTSFYLLNIDTINKRFLIE
ncbi:T9SS type A sorting domain-containing protein [Aquimarina sp. 2201CG1-2-11]|uniref:T9SS type A sorting domain-containing protein n=1 Tax=Aquimarina discodermiae TaxID=3231043 RepID=UPI0034628E68